MKIIAKDGLKIWKMLYEPKNTIFRLFYGFRGLQA